MLWGFLIISGRGLLTRKKFASLYIAQSKSVKALVWILFGIGLLLSIVLIFFFIGTFSDPSRSTDLRSEIYKAAIELFVEKPLTGQGLYTFGRGMVRLPDVQPDRPHSHAHNIVLHIAAELGVIGLIALAVTCYVIIRAIRHNWSVTDGNHQIILAGAIAAAVGFGVHQLFDVPAMMPAIALFGFTALILALSPIRPEPLKINWRQLVNPVAFAALWLILLLTGLWSNRVYARYAYIVSDAASTGAYRDAADHLQAVIDADPYLSLYRLEQAFLYGMAASTGDMDAAQEGISAYQTFIRLDPGYASAWANLSALQWQLGEHDQAVKAMQEAVSLDSEIWQYWANLAIYALLTQDESHTVSDFERALTLNPDARLYTEFSKFLPDNSSIILPDLTVPARTILLLEDGSVQDAVHLWEQSSLPENVMNDVIHAFLELAQLDRSGAQYWLARAGQIARDRTEYAWLHLGRAHFARSVEDTLTMAHEREAARSLLARAPLESDENSLLNIGYAQFLRLPIPRQFLPQVYYPVDDPILLHLLERN
jgi:tetratricopeptide (TPR) repeat protein